MTILLYRNSSVPNKVVKSITLAHTVEGTMRSDTSMLAPVFMLTGSPASLNYNYFKVQEWNRYYFLGPVEYGTNGTLTITGALDPLMSFASDIKKASAIIERQEFVYNMFLNDPLVMMNQNAKHKVIAFPNSFSAYSYILALAGNGQSGT